MIGRRNDLKNLCKRYNVNYITRNDNEGAKAGNINNALKYLKGDLFAVLDADMIPKKEFLLKTVGYFSNENMAFVQNSSSLLQSRYVPNIIYLRICQMNRISL